MVGNNTRSVVIRKNDKDDSNGTLSFDPVGRLLNLSTPSDKLAEKISNSSTTKFKIMTKKKKKQRNLKALFVVKEQVTFQLSVSYPGF